MTRRTTTSLAAAILLAVSARAMAPAAMAQDKPNIVLMMVDNLG